MTRNGKALADDGRAGLVRNVDSGLVNRDVDEDVDDRDNQVDRHEGVVVGNEHAGILHEVGVAHHIGDGGVFDYDHKLRNQRRNDKPNSLRQYDFKGDFSLGETECLGGFDLAARHGVDAGAEDLGQHAGRSERDRQREHPKRRQCDLVLGQHQKEEVDEYLKLMHQQTNDNNNLEIL